VEIGQSSLVLDSLEGHWSVCVYVCLPWSRSSECLSSLASCSCCSACARSAASHTHRAPLTTRSSTQLYHLPRSISVVPPSMCPVSPCASCRACRLADRSASTCVPASAATLASSSTRPSNLSHTDQHTPSDLHSQNCCQPTRHFHPCSSRTRCAGRWRVGAGPLPACASVPRVPRPHSLECPSDAPPSDNDPAAPPVSQQASQSHARREGTSTIWPHDSSLIK
jgi:hypothetical protein